MRTSSRRMKGVKHRLSTLSRESIPATVNRQFRKWRKSERAGGRSLNLIVNKLFHCLNKKKAKLLSLDQDLHYAIRISR